MFYIKEVVFNFFYGLFGFIIIFVIVLFFEETIVCGFISLIVDHSHLNIPSFPEHVFVFTTLEKFFSFKFGFGFIISLFFLIPFYIKQIYFFYLTLLNEIYEKMIVRFLNRISLVFFSFNFVLIFKILPLLWILVDSTLGYISESSLVNIELNSGIELYFNFMLSSTIFFNFTFFSNLIFFVYVFFVSKQKHLDYFFLSLKVFLIYIFFLIALFYSAFEIHMLFVFFLNMTLHHFCDFLFIVIILYKHIVYNFNNKLKF